MKLLAAAAVVFCAWGELSEPGLQPLAVLGVVFWTVTAVVAES